MHNQSFDGCKESAVTKVQKASRQWTWEAVKDCGPLREASTVKCGESMWRCHNGTFSYANVEGPKGRAGLANIWVLLAFTALGSTAGNAHPGTDFRR